MRYSHKRLLALMWQAARSSTVFTTFAGTLHTPSASLTEKALLTSAQLFLFFACFTFKQTCQTFVFLQPIPGRLHVSWRAVRWAPRRPGGALTGSGLMPTGEDHARRVHMEQ